MFHWNSGNDGKINEMTSKMTEEIEWNYIFTIFILAQIMWLVQVQVKDLKVASWDFVIIGIDEILMSTMIHNSILYHTGNHKWKDFESITIIRLLSVLIMNKGHLQCNTAFYCGIIFVKFVLPCELVSFWLKAGRCQAVLMTN